MFRELSEWSGVGWDGGPAAFSPWSSLSAVRKKRRFYLSVEV